MPKLYGTDKQVYIKVEQSGQEIQGFLVDSEGKRVKDGLLFTVDYTGQMVIHADVDREAARAAGVLLDGYGMMSVTMLKRK